MKLQAKLNMWLAQLISGNLISRGILTFVEQLTQVNLTIRNDKFALDFAKTPNVASKISTLPNI